MRFENTHRAVTEHSSFNADDLISLDPLLPELTQLCVELSQPTYSLTAAGKIVVDKVPDGAASPNLADAVCICFSPFQSGAYFAAGTRATITPASATSTLPARVDGVFATLAFAADAAAVVYCGTNRPARGPGLWLLDFDLAVLDATAPEWLRRVEECLFELPAAVGGEAVGLFVDDLAEGWAARLLARDALVLPIGDELPPAAERFNLARPYVASGLVTLAPGAQQREVTFRGARRNFLREVLTTPAPVETSPLAAAFALAVLLKYHGAAPVAAPELP